VTGGARAAKQVFSSMLSRTLGCPISYFEQTPLGRVLNRYTFDMEVVDVTLTQNMAMFMISIGWYCAGVAVMASILPYTLLVIAPVTVIYWFLFLHYRKSGADLQRLDAMSRSPVQAMVTEGLDGSATIRVFRKELYFVKKYHLVVNDNSSALLNFISAQRWISLRIELAGSLVVLVAALLVVCFNNVLLLDPGLIGLLIIWSSNFTITLGFLVDTFGEAEAAITAIERVDAMSKLPQEKCMTTDDEHQVPESWPSNGALEFKGVCLRYRDGLPLALDNLSFSVPTNKHVGVVGRTGAGKSTLTVALFRLTEIEAGRILLDGIDLSSVGLSDVRGRRNGMTIIPQDPFLAGSNLRDCLDPFHQSNDADIISALEAVRLNKNSNGNTGILDTLVQEGGFNFSVGERQLVNLARALLSKPKVLILDEATASIDGETDSFIQEMLRTRFKETTLVTIAHRLNTIMDYDLILVMDAGRAAEFGPPAELLENKGIFSELVDATGSESASALRAMVRKIER
jgi:ABC-type multidrug transport system fused ATPase/permease subunit